jgi:hypothetical protein
MMFELCAKAVARRWVEQASLVISLVLLLAAARCGAQSAAAAPPPPLPPDAQEIVKLSQAQLSDDVIVSYIKRSGKTYSLNADQLISLRGQGVSQAVISAMLEAKPTSVPAVQAPAPPTPTAAPVPAAPPVPQSPGPPPEAPAMPSAAPAMSVPAGSPSGPDMPVTLDYFHTQLAPYGTWVDVPGYGLCWSPTRVIAATPGGDWRPYYDNGHWVYTENGWFWVSDYSWGDIPFHYGRWIREPGYGWLWVPDLTWGPAWVCWREAEADGYIGWAPLPYGAIWVDGGWRFHGRAVVEVGFDFGLGEDFFVFVGHDHFHDHYFRYRSRLEYPFHVRREMVHRFYGRTVLRNEFRRDAHGRLVNEGLGREHIERVTGRKVEAARFEERHPAVRSEHTAAPREPSSAGAAQSGTKATSSEPNKVYRPPASTSKPATPARSPAPATRTQRNNKS